MVDVAKMAGRNESSYKRCAPACCTSLLRLSPTAAHLPLDLAIARFFRVSERPLAPSSLGFLARDHHAFEQFASCGNSLLCCRWSPSFCPQIIEATPSRAKRRDDNQIAKWHYDQVQTAWKGGHLRNYSGSK